MASCFRKRRSRSEPLPDSQEFKVLTPDHVEEVRELIRERSKREKENQKKRKLARELRKRFEAGEATELDHENAERLSRYSMEVESIDAEEAAKNEEDAKKDKENKRLEKKGENKRMEAGKKLSPKYAADFQKHLVGQPLIDIDPFYKEKEVFIVIGRDHTIFRFSAHNGLFCLSPFNPVRRLALYTLVHPLFNIVVMLTIITNCVFMAKGGDENEVVEYIFTAIYTFEFLIKMLARGLILAPFTYLRDAWNWLDFLVIMLAYVMLFLEKVIGNGSEALGNVAALRTFRVLRALKTVAVVPGLKTIVGALMEAVIKMRDVGILTVFMLSIFALVGLQLYMGKLNHKCVRDFPANMTLEQKNIWKNDESNWYGANFTSFNSDHLICGEGMGAGQCNKSAGYVCMPSVGKNPNFGYTSWDDFGSCMLNSFRIMTQDFWENIYFITIRANGTLHFFFFFFSILLGSFYLINLILAIVAMAYNDQQERDRSELQAEADEKLESDEAEAQKAADAAEDKEEQNRQKREACIQARKASAPSRVPSLEKLLTPKSFKAYDRVSLKTDFDMDDADAANKQQSLSLPSTPVPRHRASSVHDVMLTIHQQAITGQLAGPIVERKSSRPRPSLDHPSLGIDNPLPYADDSQAVTPSSVDGPLMFDYSNLENNGTAHHFSRGLRASLNSRASVRSRGSQRAPSNALPSRAMHNNLTDEQNNIPAVYISGPSKQQAMENEMLPENDLPNQYCSLTSLDTNAALKYNINMKGVDDIRDMIDITSRARTIDEQNVSNMELWKARLRQLFCSWSCCPCFLTTQKYLDLFINDAFMEVFIMICILCNTSFMAMEHYGQPKSLDVTTQYGNYVFTAVFTMESLLKLLALGPFKFFREAWNSFDFAVVSFSLFELYQELFNNGGAGGLSVLRSFRLLRVLKLAKSWKTLNSLMMIVAKSLGALGNLTVVLGIIIFIFAVMGTQLFAEKYDDSAAIFDEEAIEDLLEGIPKTFRIPRWNFKDFLHALMIVFRVLCGEWIESMWNCMRTGQEYLCIPFFLLTMVIGNLIVLNLFLVLLLSSFSADALDKKDDDDEVDKITEAKGRIMRFFKYVKKSIRAKCCTWRKGKSAANSIALPGEMVAIKSGNGTNGALIKYKDSLGDENDGLSNSKTVTMIPLLSEYDEPMEKESSLEKIGQFSTSSSCESLDDAEALVPKLDGDPLNPELTEVEDDEDVPEGYSPTLVEYETLPSPCCFPILIEKFGDVPENAFVKKFWALRCFAYRLVEHKYFEGFIIICILLSSMSLALEDVYLKDRYVLKLILNYMDKIFSGIFICEMLIKWLAFGFHKYFTNAWCWLDFVIVGISIAGLIMESSNSTNMSAFKAMRTLRALRPLRAVSRWEGMRVVVNALIQAVPSISNVLLVILIFWLIFAIMGVNFFGGKFFKCVNSQNESLHVKYRLLNASYFNFTPSEPDEKFDYTKHVLGVTNKTMCLVKGYYWMNSRINFDNVLRAYLALLQVATYKGWIEIMADATDITDTDLNPVYENRPMFYIYFVMFIIFGGFFTLNLFIGVIIENFNAQKKKDSDNAGGSLEMFMTDDQKKYYNAMKKLSASGPAKATPRPKWGPQALIFDFTINQKFDVAIMIFILLNMLTMCAEHSNQSNEFSEILVYVNIVFIVVFTLEAVLKLIALRHHYFKFPWNVFDFVVVLFSILGLAFQDSIEKYLDLSPTVLRVVRVFRVGRVLRLVKSAKGIRTLLFSLLVSLPALFNIGLLLFLVIFIYATFGMAFFGKVKKTAGIDEVFNFETFFQALITLFQCTTSAGWSGVYAAISNEEDCETFPDKTTNCGNEQLGTVYMVSYLLFTFLVIINMYIAVILENFSQATEDVQQGITQDDIEMYYELWSTYDPKATKYIPVDKLFDLVDELEDPLRVAKPNYFRLVMTDIPVCEGDKIHCNDILDMLTRIFLKQDAGLDPTAEDPNADNNIPQSDAKEKNGEDYNPIYGLLERQRHKWAARFIWRRYLAYRAAKYGSVEGAATCSAQVTVENELQVSDALPPKKDKKTKRSTSKTEMGSKS